MLTWVCTWIKSSNRLHNRDIPRVILKWQSIIFQISYISIRQSMRIITNMQSKYMKTEWEKRLGVTWHVWRIMEKGIVRVAG